MTERVSEDVMAAIAARNGIAQTIQELREKQQGMENRIHALLAEDVGSTSVTMRYGADQIVRISDIETTHVIDEEGQVELSELVAKDPRLVRRLINLKNPSRWAGMRSILDDYYPGGWEACNKSYVEWGEKPAATSVKFIPIDKSPKFAQALEEGEAIIR